MSSRINEPMPVRDHKSWRLGKLCLERNEGRHGGWQVDWGHCYRVVECSGLKLALSLNHFHDNHHYSLQFFGIWVRLPWRTNRSEPCGEIMSSWGFSAYFEGFGPGGLHLNWGHKSKVIYWPWDYHHMDDQHEVLLANESWAVVPKPRYVEGQPYKGDEELVYEAYGPRWVGAYEYRYMLRSGEVQLRQAVVTVERRAWRRRWLPAWLPLFQLRKTTIDIKFFEEVGERTGSWKGGTTACSYEMRPGERPVDTLKRMQQERRFN